MATEPQKRCLYEVLGVPRDCSQEEIRSAYRRLALQLHPDKVAASGVGDVASATAAFQELLHAYEVLSDRKERAWYDSHRSQILFPDPSASKGQKPPAFFDLDLFAFFSSSVFSGYSDSGKGFYKVYGDLFAKVYEQETWFAKQMDLGADAVAPAPLIGNLDSPYSQVSAFYNYWLGFSTVMDFGWVDEYDSSLGPNRRSRRAMEEENKKLRKKARREYIDTVRGLAAFAKKRDKRVVDMVVKKNLEEEKRRAEEKAKKKEEERKKMERTKLYQEPEWAKINEEEHEFDGFEDEDDKKKKCGQEFYCVVCNKKFKSDKQWKNHEQSKKHKDKVAELRLTFEDDEEFVEEKPDDGSHVSFDYDPQESEESDAFEEVSEKFADALEFSENDEDAGHQEDVALQENDNEEEHAEETDDEASILEAMVTGRRKNDYFNHDDSLLNNNPNNVEQSSMDFGSQKRGRKNHASGKEDSEEDSEIKEKDEISREETEVQNQESSPFLNDESPSQSLKVKSAVSKKNISIAKNQKSKKQQADGKGAGKKVPPADSNLLRGKKQKAMPQGRLTRGRGWGSSRARSCSRGCDGGSCRGYGRTCRHVSTTQRIDHDLHEASLSLYEMIPEAQIGPSVGVGGHPEGQPHIVEAHAVDPITSTSSIIMEKTCISLLASLVKVRFPLFYGGTDHWVARTWLKDIEYTFGYMSCSDTEKIELAAFHFRGQASSWWKMQRIIFGDKVISWQSFREAFERQYIPAGCILRCLM